MFDNKIDVVKAYGLKPVSQVQQTYSSEAKVIKTFNPTTARKKSKSKAKKLKIIDANKTWREYQELRQTKPFKQWWWQQKEKQRGLCYYCLNDLDYNAINVEHMKPMSAGGTNNYSNLVLACQPCNKEKGSTVLSKGKRKSLRLKMEEVLRIKKYIDDNMWLMTDFELKVYTNIREAHQEFRKKGI